jgi:hypothetical protein
MPRWNKLIEFLQQLGVLVWGRSDVETPFTIFHMEMIKSESIPAENWYVFSRDYALAFCLPKRHGPLSSSNLLYESKKSTSQVSRNHGHGVEMV